MRFRCPRLPLVLLLCTAAACGEDSGGPSGPVDEGISPTAGCSDGVMSSGALYRTCFPADWNGELIVYAHGYVRSDAPLAVQDDMLAGVPVSSLVTGLGYAFATTSYRYNGLVADVAVDDLTDLVDRVRQTFRPDPVLTYLVGVSEGGLVAALAAERDPERFSGALAACGPVGDFATQIDYIGDFRVVFDYFFPGVLPGSVVDVPDDLRANWESQYVPAVLAALVLNPGATLQLLEVTGAATAEGDVQSIGATVIGLLWYSVYATEDAQLRLGGQPFDNTARVYQGSSDDTALNAGVARHGSDPAARAAFGRFDTAGDIAIPVVTLHTTGDPVVPFLHETLYGSKVSAAGKTALLAQQSADRYGHCAFEQFEVQSAFGTLVQQVAAAAPAHP
jgi:pimeloyl-ACP methyl ester carboxylesterase